MAKKTIKCLKCKKKMTVEVDGKGIPYNKICNACKRRYASYGRGVVTAY